MGMDSGVEPWEAGPMTETISLPLKVQCPMPPSVAPRTFVMDAHI